MKKPNAQQRLIQNEATFRAHNESVQAGFDKMNQLARDEGHHGLVHASDSPLLFYCECSDEDCKRRIQLQPSIYQRLHRDRRNFVIIRGHEVAAVEHVIEKYPDFCVVTKHVMPPEGHGRLQPTNVHNV